MSAWLLLALSTFAVLFVHYSERVLGCGCALVLWVIERWRGDNEYDD